MSASLPRPALVSRQAAARLPRVALILFCAAYVLPGVFGREPWKHADLTAFGVMAALADGRAGWFAPQIAGLPVDGGLLPYWIGAVAILSGTGWIEPALAARLPFALLLVGILALTWYATYHLARTEAAQPLPFPFGGEADPVDYSRAIADGAVLATIATLGLLQLGHETTPELVQLFGVSLVLYAVAASPYRGAAPKVAAFAGVATLAGSGAPTIAVALGTAGVLTCARSSYPPTRAFVPWLAAATVAATVLATAWDAWTWRVQLPVGGDALLATVRLFAWFTWPTLPLAAWTLWRWRTHLTHRHIAVPAGSAAVGLLAGIGLGGSDRALLLAVPALAVLASFALPTLRRSSAAAVDWFSVFFFSICAIVIWVVYVAFQTGVPARPAANVARLAPGFVPSFSLPELVAAIAATVAWLWLVTWRTGRHRHPLWKSMVLPASGVALCWTLLLTLWLPLLDHARSHKPLTDRLAPLLARGSCIWAPQAPTSLLAALQHYQRRPVVGDADAAAGTECATRLEVIGRGQRAASPAEGWRRVGEARHPSDRDNRVVVYHRTGGR